MVPVVVVALVVAGVTSVAGAVVAVTLTKVTRIGSGRSTF